MDISRMIDSLKAHPDFSKMGMIASHLGIVRGTSIDGREVRGIEIKFDRELLSNIINDSKKMKGITQILVEVSEGSLSVGDEIMAVVVGGDIRDHVFPALIDTVNRIKSEATKKKELF